MIFYLTNFLIGACLASHACLIYDRFDTGSVVFARSECRNCHYQLSILDEIPILSYILLHGRCRYCAEAIPYQLLQFEFLGGLSFMPIDFSTPNGMAYTIFIFFLLLISIFDYHEGEFPTFLLFPLLLIVPYADLTAISLINLLPIAALLGYFILKNQLGTGDLIVYLFFCLYLGATRANIALLLACLFAIGNYFLSQKQEAQIYFLPYIMLGFAIVNIF